ncbi:MAG: sugar phosphate nucleotidyltransferase, partial [Ignavibacteriaceae bacterium]
MRAMILAAGLGTRLKPITDSTPKALVKVGNTTLLEICIKNLKVQGTSDIIINVHHFAAQIKNFLAENNNFG